VTLTSQADPDLTVTEIAPTDDVNRLLYAAEFNDQLAAGRWEVSLRVSGPLGVGEGVAFSIDVEPARGFNWLWLGGGGLIVVVLVWIVASLRGEKSAALASRRASVRKNT
jgi:hypothetical protein